MNWYLKHQSLEKFASKVVMYHGTSLKNLQSIMSQGLIPSPKKRVWQEDPDASSRTMSRKSFEGIYLSDHFMTAKVSATRASSTTNGLIVVVQVENKTLVLDEDNIVYMFQSRLMHLNEGFIMNEWLMQQTYIEYRLGKIEGKFDKAADDFLAQCTVAVDEPKRGHVKEATKPLVIDVIKAMLVRQISYFMKELSAYDLSRFKRELEQVGLRMEDIPSIEVSEAQTRWLMDKATRKFGFLNQIKREDYSQKTARSLTPIGFNGANRILCVMSFEVSRTDPQERAYVLTFHYSSDRSAADTLLKAWKTSMGYQTKVVGL